MTSKHTCRICLIKSLVRNIGRFGNYNVTYLQARGGSTWRVSTRLRPSILAHRSNVILDEYQENMRLHDTNARGMK